MDGLGYRIGVCVWSGCRPRAEAEEDVVGRGVVERVEVFDHQLYDVRVVAAVVGLAWVVGGEEGDLVLLAFLCLH